MQIMLFLLAALFTLLPWIILFMVFHHRSQIRELKERIDRLESVGIEPVPARAAADVPDVAPAPPPLPPPPPPPEPSPVAPVVTMAASVAETASTRPTTPVTAAPPLPEYSPRSRYDEPAREPRLDLPRLDPTRLEQQIGGIWMQNVGSVLLLLGAFFLIVWGYATGRIGPEILVLAGVALGVVVSWRGNVIARSLQALGNALVGVGLGTIYITLHVGHFRMGVLPQWAAFSSITLVALLTVAIGLRRREPIIATLGVLGAFLPQLMAVWIPLQGFRLPLPTLLTYFAVVNGVVFALAATVGWSGLVILSMLLTMFTWTANAGGGWTFGTQLGLTALFAGLGLAPVVRLARVPAQVRNIDLLVVALAPLLLLLCSIPYLTQAGRIQAAWLLGGIGVFYIGGAIWVESRRERRDLWKPLTGAATLFLTAALERGIDPEHLAMAWAAEGVVLIALGIGAGRDAWLRALGYGVSALSGCWLTYILLTHWGGADRLRFLELATLRDLFCVGALLGASHLIGRKRDRLTESERSLMPGLSAVVANLLLMLWIAREAGSLRLVLPSISGPNAASAATLLMGAAWSLHALVLFVLGRRPGAAMLRHIGYLVVLGSVLAWLTAYGSEYFWRQLGYPFVSTTALIGALATIVLLAGSNLHWRDRERLGPSERRMPEVVCGAANALLMVWIAREAVRLREVLPGIGGSAAGTASWTLAGVGWLLQALVLMALASRSGASVLRHFGYIIGGAGAMALWAGHATRDVWASGQPPFLNTSSVIAGVGILVLIACSELLWRGRDRLGASERRMPEIAAGVANGILLLWWAREAGHLAAVLDPGGTRAGGGARTLAAIFTSAAWTLQAIALFTIGWIRNSAFLRWSGLVLFGLTVVKFLAVDLDRVDAFWRFVGAVGIGAALLVVSFLYQRRSRRMEAPARAGGVDVPGVEAP